MSGQESKENVRLLYSVLKKRMGQKMKIIFDTKVNHSSHTWKMGRG